VLFMKLNQSHSLLCSYVVSNRIFVTTGWTNLKLHTQLLLWVFVSNHGCPAFSWQKAMLFIVGWFTDHTWNNNNKRYNESPYHLNYCVISTAQSTKVAAGHVNNLVGHMRPAVWGQIFCTVHVIHDATECQLFYGTSKVPI
jgi:hypothetical protein